MSTTETTTPPAPAVNHTVTERDRILRVKIIELLPHGTEVDEERLDELLGAFHQSSNDLIRGYADQTANFARYIGDYSVMSSKYYALALAAVNTAEKALLVVDAPPAGSPTAQAWTVFKDTIRAVKESLMDTREVKVTGALAIVRERVRQLTVEGWTPELDVIHMPQDLAQAGICYVMGAHEQWANPGLTMEDLQKPFPGWPWVERKWKPSGDALRNLEIGCALLAAAYDRQLALNGGGQ